VFTFGLAMSAWVIFPVYEGSMLADFRLGMLYIFAVSSLSVHSVIRAGWSSNSKYAFLGGLRSAAQRISYEVSLGATLVSLLLFSSTLNFSTIVENQSNLWYGLPLFPIFIIFFITTLAETNRHPFDLPEAEAELVSGYNVEYSAMGFALFFLAEYGNIILMSGLSALFFLGGWQFNILTNIFNTFSHYVFNINTPIMQVIPFSFVFAIKIRLFITLFVLVRGTFPRYRYDQLMRLGWKVYLPFSLAFIIVYSSIIFSFNSFLELSR
jgi:NADH-quinone oxidoreductase subunit H